LSGIKKAYQIEFERNVALKYLKDDGHKSEEEYYRNFIREIQILTKLNAVNNKNIIRFLGISKGLSPKSHYIILQDVYGEDLRTHLQEKFIELSWPSKIKMAKDITNGLTYIHRANIVHCNLNSKNIMVYDDKLIITGFDFSIFLDRPYESPDTLELCDHEMISYVDPQLLMSP
ncbi:11774_t:CDS:2, partial [Acaulospora morrowiae]